MGGTGTKLKPVKRVQATDLMGHPSFTLPPLPRDLLRADDEIVIKASIKYALECAARLVSPSPKEDDEDESFSCDDLAAAIRGLGKKITPFEKDKWWLSFDDQETEPQKVS